MTWCAELVGFFVVHRVKNAFLSTVVLYRTAIFPFTLAVAFQARRFTVRSAAQILSVAACTVLVR
jgi:hypothetical protein